MDLIDNQNLDTVYSQLKFFIPAGWDHAQVFGDIGVALSFQNMGFLKAGTAS